MTDCHKNIFDCCAAFHSVERSWYAILAVHYRQESSVCIINSNCRVCDCCHVDVSSCGLIFWKIVQSLFWTWHTPTHSHDGCANVQSWAEITTVTMCFNTFSGTCTEGHWTCASSFCCLQLCGCQSLDPKTNQHATNAISNNMVVNLVTGHPDTCFFPYLGLPRRYLFVFSVHAGTWKILVQRHEDAGCLYVYSEVVGSAFIFPDCLLQLLPSTVCNISDRSE